MINFFCYIAGMATYAIGDIQGCYRTFSKLLKRISFNPTYDTLWLVGDVINRGSASLEVLRFLQAHEDHIVMVLGNHDLHVLSVAYGVRGIKPNDTLSEILQAPDRDILLRWLQQRPIMYQQDNWVMLHAGLLPSWSIAHASTLARKIEACLQGPDVGLFLTYLSDVAHDNAHKLPNALQTLAFAANVFTYVRICDIHGIPFFNFTGAPEAIPQGYTAWFTHPTRQNSDVDIVCGHWAALGLYTKHRLHALDTGCVWGRHLTAYRLEDAHIFQEPAVREDYDIKGML